VSSAEAIQELLDSPELPRAVERLAAVVDSERERRERFYDEITPSMKAEFINGEIIVHSPVSYAHAVASKNLLRILETYVVAHRLGVVLVEKALVTLTRNDYEPDLCFFSTAKASQFRAATNKFPAPDLVIEILSESTASRDRGIKFRDYAVHGVGEYWLVDTAAAEVEQYLLNEAKCYQLKLKSASGQIESTVIQGLRIPIPAIFDAEAAQEVLKQLLH
jgi:Uma2 family endonuclease